MKLHSDYSHLESATSSSEMRQYFQEKLQHLWHTPVELDGFCIPRVFPVGDDAFVVQYRMFVKSSYDTPPKPLILYGNLLGSKEDWPAYVEKHKDVTFVLKNLRMVVPVFPFDPRLNKLAELCSPVNALPILRSCYEPMGLNGSDPTDVSYEILGYRLERRCVLRYKLSFSKQLGKDSNICQVVAKVMRPRQAKITMSIINMLKTNGFDNTVQHHMTVPKTYFVDTKNGIHFMESVPGFSLHDLIGDKSFIKACEAAAKLLRKLHTIVSPELPEYNWEQELVNLQIRVTQASKMFPDWAKLFKQAYHIIGTCVDDNIKRYNPVCLHRDFYDKQVFFSLERTTLLDFDNFVYGDPAQDYGNFIAHLFLRSLQEPGQAENIQRGMQTFESAYGIPDEAFASRARWWQATTLLRLAALYSLRPNWRHLTNKLLGKVDICNQEMKLN